MRRLCVGVCCDWNKNCFPIGMRVLRTALKPSVGVCGGGLMIAKFIVAIMGIYHSCIGFSETAKLNQEQERIIARHRSMAAVHSAVAKCLEAGRAYESCHQEAVDSCRKDFAGECPGMALGRGSGGRSQGCLWMKTVGTEQPKGVKSLSK